MQTRVEKKVHEGKQKLSLFGPYRKEFQTMPPLMIAMSNGEKQKKVR
jgi:hypothetical protein